MANKQALRDLQARLAQRLQEARTAERPAGWLAVECAGQGFLLPLAEAGEIFQDAEVAPVPHTATWFAGVANLRGVLTGVADLAGFLGLTQRPAAEVEGSRLVAFNPALDVNAALLIDRLAGLRNAEQLSIAADVDPALPGFAGRRLRDDAGRVWQELRLALLARDERFLNIVAED
ncbi:MAG: chemotaxis protein CheW [Burkholderiales bacterium]